MNQHQINILKNRLISQLINIMLLNILILTKIIQKQKNRVVIKLNLNSLELVINSGLDKLGQVRLGWRLKVRLMKTSLIMSNNSI